MINANRLADAAKFVPTIDESVVGFLRYLGEPIKLFGEDPFDRRARAIQVLSSRPAKTWQAILAEFTTHQQLEATEEVEARGTTSDSEGDAEVADEPFYSPGNEGLLQFRRALLTASIRLSAERLGIERSLNEAIHSVEDGGCIKSLRSYEIGSGDLHVRGDMRVMQPRNHDRPVSAIAVYCSTSDKILRLCSGDWGGCVKFEEFDRQSDEWAFDNARRSFWVNECGGRALGLDVDSSSVVFSNSLVPSKLFYRNIENDAVSGTIQAHDEGSTITCLRLISNESLLPSSYLVSGSDDHTYCLISLETQDVVLQQEGHTAGLSAISNAHPDLSLIATGDQSGCIHVWDLRCGLPILSLERQHHQKINSISFGPCGYILASGGDDHSVKVVDLRKRNNVATILGHERPITHCALTSRPNETLISCSLDGAVKLWNARTDFTESHSGTVGGGKALCGSTTCTNSGKFVSVFGCFDKTTRAWSVDVS